MISAAEPPLAPMLRKLEYWGSFSDAEKAALLALPHTIRTIEPHKYVVREHDRAAHCCLLRSGFLFRHKTVGDGSRQILSIHMAGDIVDLQNSLLEISDHSVQALTTAEVAYIPRDAIPELAFRHPSVGRALWYDTLVDGSIFREWVTNIGRRDARARIAHLLCEFAVRLDAAGLGKLTNYELPMTQEQLADCTGLTPVHVNRTLRTLAEEGLIIRSNRSVTIGDWKRLTEAGDFETTYLHLEDSRLAMMQ
jgi:CRP-like cAMP-binding protein